MWVFCWPLYPFYDKLVLLWIIYWSIKLNTIKCTVPRQMVRISWRMYQNAMHNSRSTWKLEVRKVSQSYFYALKFVQAFLLDSCLKPQDSWSWCHYLQCNNAGSCQIHCPWPWKLEQQRLHTSRPEVEARIVFLKKTKWKHYTHNNCDLLLDEMINLHL